MTTAGGAPSQMIDSADTVMELPTPVRFGRKIEIRCPIEMAQAVGIAAGRKQQRSAEWLRSAIRAALIADGIDAAS